MNEVEQIKTVIQHLEMFAKRPTMYFGDYIPPVLNFLRGMIWILKDNVNIGIYYKIYNEFLIERGWEVTAFTPVDQMTSKGMDDDAVTQEFLDIELETWRRVLIVLQSNLSKNIDNK